MCTNKASKINIQKFNTITIITKVTLSNETLVRKHHDYDLLIPLLVLELEWSLHSSLRTFDENVTMKNL